MKIKFERCGIEYFFRRSSWRHLIYLKGYAKVKRSINAGIGLQSMPTIYILMNLLILTPSPFSTHYMY